MSEWRADGCALGVMWEGKAAVELAVIEARPCARAGPVERRDSYAEAERGGSGGGEEGLKQAARRRAWKREGLEG